MKFYFKLIILILCSYSLNCFSQDPSCQFVVNINDIDESKYDYKIIIDYQYDKEPIDAVKEKLYKNWELNYWGTVESSILKSNIGNKMLIGYKSDYCYPSNSITDQLRIIIARRKKGNTNIEFMYGLCPLVPSRTEIIIDTFKSGQRKCEVFEYEKDYVDAEHTDYGRKQHLSLKSRKVFLK